MVEVERARLSLDQIRARHDDILKIEKSIKELRDMFRDLALLVGDQVGQGFHLQIAI